MLFTENGNWEQREKGETSVDLLLFSLWQGPGLRFSTLRVLGGPLRHHLLLSTTFLWHSMSSVGKVWLTIQIQLKINFRGKSVYPGRANCFFLHALTDLGMWFHFSFLYLEKNTKIPSRPPSPVATFSVSAPLIKHPQRIVVIFNLCFFTSMDFPVPSNASPPLLHWSYFW